MGEQRHISNALRQVQSSFLILRNEKKNDLLLFINRLHIENVICQIFHCSVLFQRVTQIRKRLKAEARRTTTNTRGAGRGRGVGSRGFGGRGGLNRGR